MFRRFYDMDRKRLRSLPAAGLSMQSKLGRPAQ
jgi:hypothetical protein